MNRDVADLRVGVVGLGAMGRGIARRFARAGARVLVTDVDADTTRRATGHLRDEAAADDDEVDLLSEAPNLDELVPQVDLLVEAVLENLTVKTELVARISRLASPGLAVATNTSSLSVDELGQAYGTPERLLGLHFFNPPTRMRLVEVVAGTRTDESLVREALRWVEQLGQVPIRCVDSPNFVVNRVCRPLYHESARLVSAGVPAAVVDAVTRHALGHRVGPLELLDQIGLHTHLASSESAYAQLADSRYAPVPLVRQLVRAGALGVRSGRGFYDYSVSTRPRDAQRAVVHAPREDTGVGIEIEGDGAERLAPLSRDGPDPVTVVADGGAYDESHGALVRDLVASGRSAVVESSDAAWAYALPEGAGWVRLHPVHEGWFGERVVDDIAGVRVTEGVQALFAAVGARAVDVPALPGLVADRLSDCLVNEATWVVQERVAAPGAVDIALRLGMNHPLGPFEVLDRARPRLILARLRAMQAASGDPRYRPSSQLQRMAAAEP